MEQLPELKKSDRLPEVDEFFSLAESCKVSMYAVCMRTKTPPATPDRWKNGRGGPSLTKLKELRAAVIEIAKERGTLPEGVES